MSPVAEDAAEDEEEEAEEVAAGGGDDEDGGIAAAAAAAEGGKQCAMMKLALDLPPKNLASNYSPLAGSASVDKFRDVYFCLFFISVR